MKNQPRTITEAIRMLNDSEFTDYDKYCVLVHLIDGGRKASFTAGLYVGLGLGLFFGFVVHLWLVA